MNFRNKIEHFFQELLDFLYPVRIGHMPGHQADQAELEHAFLDVLRLNYESCPQDIDDINRHVFDQLPTIKSKLDKDIEALYLGDPAAVSRDEVVIAYPGFYAIAAYRLAHFLLQEQVPLIPRVITEHAHSYTGIDIHPGAAIGEYLCLDHGTGIVIGETAVIGDHVKIYQGVTLGALSVPQRHIDGQRHPTIEDHVVIYAQATILGGETIIGHHSIIGGNVWIIDSVPPYSKIYYTQQDTVNNKFSN